MKGLAFPHIFSFREISHTPFRGSSLLLSTHLFPLFSWTSSYVPYTGKAHRFLNQLAVTFPPPPIIHTTGLSLRQLSILKRSGVNSRLPRSTSALAHNTIDHKSFPNHLVLFKNHISFLSPSAPRIILSIEWKFNNRLIEYRTVILVLVHWNEL